LLKPKFRKPGEVTTIPVVRPPTEAHYQEDGKPSRRLFDLAVVEYRELKAVQCDAKKYGKKTRVAIEKMLRADEIEKACELAVAEGLAALHVIWGPDEEDVSTLPIEEQITAAAEIGLTRHLGLAIVHHNKATPRQGES